MPTTPRPGSPAPSLVLDVAKGDRFDLAAAGPEHFTMLVFYRGMHCPVCRKQLRELEGRLDDFTSRGVDVVAVSMDDEDRALRSIDEWELDRLPVAHGLTEDDARTWGLHLSSAISDSEPARFSEPGVALVRPDGTLYALDVASMPFIRPDLDLLLKGIDFAVDQDYPPRGVEA